MSAVGGRGRPYSRQMARPYPATLAEAWTDDMAPMTRRRRAITAVLLLGVFLATGIEGIAGRT